ncbi:DUF3804 family protein [Prochlorococcus marinus]|nr:DUF3804 family protein [Prochlorococcus marinus]
MAFKTLSSDSQSIEALIKGFANRSENKSFLISNVTENFLAIRPSGNPITAEDLVGMYNNADLVVEVSELVKIHRLEANADWGFAAFTLKEQFSYKGENNNDLSSYSMIFQKRDGAWKISWMQRSSGTTDLSTWN